jgi:hypothetical protein
MPLAEDGGMNTWRYRITQSVCVVALLVAETVLCFVLIWLIQGGGVVACGKGIFNDPYWPLDVAVLVGTPTVVMIATGALFLWCSGRLAQIRKVVLSHAR